MEFFPPKIYSFKLPKKQKFNLLVNSLVLLTYSLPIEKLTIPNFDPN
jgi:hypothetical protein